MSEIARLTIGMRLPSLNEYISKLNHNKYAANKFKADIQAYINGYILASKLKPITSKIDLQVHWYESTKKRDSDNIFSAIKYILDSLQEMKIIENDSQKYIRHIHNYLEHAEADYVVVIFKEAL